MAEPIAAQPDLYSTAAPGLLRLKGGRCRACNYVFFPPQQYGCEACGAPSEQLDAISLAACGALHSFATVHLYQGKGIEAPFTVGVILLDAGPAVRSILTNRTGEGLKAGDRMIATMVPQGAHEQGREIVELRFMKDESTAMGERR